MSLWKNNSIFYNNHWKLYSTGKYWSIVLYNFFFILWDLIYIFKVSCLLYVLFLFVSLLSLTMIFLSGEENLHNCSICKTVLLGESWSQKVSLEHVTESLPQPIFFFFFFFAMALFDTVSPEAPHLPGPCSPKATSGVTGFPSCLPALEGENKPLGTGQEVTLWAIPGPCEAGAT